MYYIWSLLFAITIFIIIQYRDYQKEPQTYNVYTFSNIGTFMLIYLIMTIVCYFIFEIDYKSLNKIQPPKLGGSLENAAIDPSMLKRIPDNIYTGFTPYDTDI